MDAIGIRLTAVRVASDTGGIVDIETVEPGRTACLSTGACNFGVAYRPRFSADPNPDAISPADTHKMDNVSWEVTTDGHNTAVFTLEDPDGDGEYEWVKRGKGPFHGGNHALGQRTHGNDIVLVVTEGAGSSFTVVNKRNGLESNVLGPYKLGRQ